jgi:hypothetical protein
MMKIKISWNLKNLIMTDTTKPSGISKHLYSTNPDNIVGENIYSTDKTSINKEESYQTLDNRTVPVDSQEKVNPFNVKGVPGCSYCGGRGWRDDKGPPHPCNECAKKTVPVIDTHLTMVGHTTTPTLQSTVEGRNTENVEQYSTQPNITKLERNIREIEQVNNVPVTREVKYTEEVPVTTKVPVTKYEEVTKSVPVEKTEYVTETVPVISKVPVLEETQTRTTVLPTKEYDIEKERTLMRETHTHDDLLKNEKLIQPFQGIPGCKECSGDGWRRSKLTGAKKPCSHCIDITGNCPLCGNSGRRLDKDKKCKCKYGKALP